MRNNYGQPHGSAGALCCFTAVAPLAAGGSKAAFGIRGGNARLAERMLERAGPNPNPSLTLALTLNLTLSLRLSLALSRRA